MHPDESDDIDRALKGLPAPRAPRTMLPRIMAARGIARGRGLRRGPGSTGRSRWQLASAALVIVFAIGVGRLWPGAESAIGRSVAPVIDSVTSAVGDLTDRTSVVVTLARVVWRAVVQPLSGYALLLVLVMGAACATFGAALDRVALGGHT